MASEREAAIATALAGFRNGRYSSLRAAAKAHSVTPTTLSRRHRGTVSHKQRGAERLLLPPNIEEDLVTLLLKWEAADIYLWHAQIRDLVTLVLRSSGQQHVVGNNWIPRFLLRHPEIKTKRHRSVPPKEN